MDILVVTNTPHDPNQGSGYGITGYLRGLRERGHYIDAHGPSDWKAVSFPRGGRYIYPFMMAAYGLRKLQGGEYDVVELWGAESWLLAVLCKLLKPNMPLVHHSNGIEQHRIEVQRDLPVQFDNTSLFQIDLSRLHDFGLHAADAIVTLNSYDVDFLEKRKYVAKQNIHAIDTPLPASFLQQSITHERPRRVGFCGSWIPRKGISVFEKDMTRFLLENEKWTFSVVGVGDKEVLSHFPEEVHDQIEVTPFLKRKDLKDWYKSLRVFAIPSFYDSFGLVMSEAMACGAALVATNVGFAHGLQDGKEALIIPEKPSPHLYRVLSRLASNEKLRRYIAQNGYERVQSLRWDDAVDRLESIYENIIAKKKTATSSL